MVDGIVIFDIFHTFSDQPNWYISQVLELEISLVDFQSTSLAPWPTSLYVHTHVCMFKMLHLSHALGVQKFMPAVLLLLKILRNSFRWILCLEPVYKLQEKKKWWFGFKDIMVTFDPEQLQARVPITNGICQ